MAKSSAPLVQDELRQLAKEISVQVLKNQPENIYKFTSDYLNKQLEKRERTGVEIFIRELIENDLTYEALLNRRGITLNDANRATSVMQSAVRRFLYRQKAQRKIKKIQSLLDVPLSEGTEADGGERFVMTGDKPPADGEPQAVFRSSSSCIAPRALCMNPGTSEGDIVRADGPGPITPLVAAKNMGAFDEQEENVYAEKDRDDAPAATESDDEVVDETETTTGN